MPSNTSSSGLDTVLVGCAALAGLFGLGRVAEARSGRDGVSQRLDAIEAALERLERPRRRPASTRRGLRASILRDVDARLEAHARSVESLRAMVEHTDVMLERVLEALEGAKA